MRVGDGVGPPAGSFEPVGLQVALVDDVQADLVAQVEEPRVRRVVAGTHGIEIVGLHEKHVAEHLLLRNGPALIGVELAPVDPAADPTAVDGQQPIDHRHRAEPDPDRDPFAAGGDRGLVEPRLLRAPRLHALDPGGLAGSEVQAQLGHGEPGRNVSVDTQGAGTGRVVEVGVDEEVVQAGRGPAQ